RLRVTDNDGATDTQSQSVVVQNRAPSASFTVSPPSPLTNQTTTFDSAASTDPDGTIASRAWDLDNDGSFDDGTGTTAQRTFATAATYTVRLRVTDNDGATDTQSQSVTVSDTPPVNQPPPTTLVPQLPVLPAFGSADTQGPLMKVLNRRVRLSRRGVAVIRLRCPPDEIRCIGTLSLQRSSRRAQRTAASVIGRAVFDLRGGAVASVRVKLRSKARRSLAGVRRTSLLARIVARDAVSNNRSTDVRLRLTAPRPR
ncbi:MAG: PKD domain-containing protein, partial [Solirubrobacterales bacterium]